jgi:glycosyltransferase involved in cell wall biosynthesis
MSAPAVSVIVPTHNGERFLAEAIRSILAQPAASLEVIVVDDGSEDGAAGIAAAFGEPVRVVSQPRGGPAAARNLGITSARGVYIGFLDHDDVWAPDKLRLQLSAFAARPGLDVCVGHIQRFRGDFSGPDRKLIGVPQPGFLTVTMLARREAFDRVGLLDSTLLHADTAEWFLRATQRGLSVHLLPDVLTYHRDHESNLSVVRGERSRREFLRLAKARMDWLRAGAAREAATSADGPEP